MGGEIFTLFFTRALVEIGIPVTLFVAARNAFWRDADLAGVAPVPIEDARDLIGAIPDAPALVVTNGPVPQAALAQLAQRHLLSGFAHMPAHGRDTSGYRKLDTVFCVSQYVIDGLREDGLTNVYPHPFYGVAEFRRYRSSDLRVVARSPYAWDRRKVRDRVLGWFLADKPAQRVPAAFERKPGLTLGIVSGLVPIKQFPLLFRHLAPILQDYPQVNVEIFGAGGYGQVRDLLAALAPIRKRVRLWGRQPAPELVYPQIDYLMTGLPEKEALGLNVIEAQACGTPVLAVAAPPFVETVLDGRTGYLYQDPRRDGGADFRRVLEHILASSRPNPLLETAHLDNFGAPAFRARVEAMFDYLERRLPV